MSSLAMSTSGWAVVGIGVAITVVYILYQLALPKPLPGIPYNKHSAKRLLGDIPEFQALENSGQVGRQFWADLATTHGSPITQTFLGPFKPPVIVISDFREAQDLIVRRGKDFGRGMNNRQAWSGIVPEHFIGMDDDDPRFNDRKGLLKDLMTPTFLHEVRLHTLFWVIIADHH